jgi:hypothetical protein
MEESAKKTGIYYLANPISILFKGYRKERGVSCVWSTKPASAIGPVVPGVATLGGLSVQ